MIANPYNPLINAANDSTDVYYDLSADPSIKQLDVPNLSLHTEEANLYESRSTRCV